MYKIDTEQDLMTTDAQASIGMVTQKAAVDFGTSNILLVQSEKEAISNFGNFDDQRLEYSKTSNNTKDWVTDLEAEKSSMAGIWFRLF